MAQSRRIAVIMFTDIVGYTALMGKDERVALTLLHKNRELHQRLLGQFNGHLLKELGDGMLCSFETTTDAVYCAGMLMQDLKEVNGLQLRIGIHLGEVVVEGNDLYGNGVNIASRIEGIASKGQLLVSEAVYKNIRNKSEIKTTFVGEHMLKNVEEPVRVYSVQVEKIPESYSQTVSASRRIKSKYVSWTFISILVALSMLLYLIIKKPSIASNDQPGVNSILVLPFTNMSDDKAQEYFCDAMTDQINTNLASVQGLQVIGQSSAKQFKDTKLSIREIAHDFGVDFILKSGVQKIGDNMRLNAQLMNADGIQLWAETLDRTAPTESMFAMQDELSSYIVTTISEELEFKLEHDTRPTSTEAYDKFMEAKYIAINEYFWNKPDSVVYMRAYKLYEKAIELDTNFAEAYAGLADLIDARIFNYELGLLGAPDEELYRLREEYTDHAYQLDSNSAFTNYMKATFLVKTSGPLEDEFYHFKKAVQLDPKDPYYYLCLAIPFYKSGLFDQAIKCLDKGIQLDPLEPRQYAFYGGCLMLKGDTEEGIEMFEKCRELNKNGYQDFGVFPYVLTLSINGELEKARQYIQGRKKAGFAMYNIEDLYYAATGEKDKIEMMDNWEVKAILNEWEYIFDKWERSFISPTEPNWSTVIQRYKSLSHPLYDPIRDDARFVKYANKEKEIYDSLVKRFGTLPF